MKSARARFELRTVDIDHRLNDAVIRRTILMINAERFEPTEMSTIMRKIDRINVVENNDSQGVIWSGNGKQT
jgi:hypothetical protein